MTWIQRAGRTRTASRVRAGGLVVGCAAAVLVACGSGGVGGEESSSAASADGGTHADRTGFGGDDGGALGALVLEPANATLDVGAPGASLPFKATIGGRDVTSGLAWSIESASLGTVDASGTFRASAKHGGVTVVHVASGTRRASANLTVNLKLVDEGTVDKATIAKLAGAATGPAHGWLYPYEGTVFPRGLLPPKLQFDSATGEAVKLRVRAKSLDYTGYFKGSNPGRIDLSPALWTMITLSAGSNDPVTFDVAGAG
ncbi:MAG: hypothetical protein U0169_13090 [Polyangiaceae bacterium]